MSVTVLFHFRLFIPRGKNKINAKKLYNENLFSFGATTFFRSVSQIETILHPTKKKHFECVCCAKLLKNDDLKKVNE